MNLTRTIVLFATLLHTLRKDRKFYASSYGNAYFHQRGLVSMSLVREILFYIRQIEFNIRQLQEALRQLFEFAK